MSNQVDLTKYDFSQPFCGTFTKYSHVWRAYHIDKASSLKLKGLSLLLYKLMIPIASHFKLPCSQNYYIS